MLSLDLTRLEWMLKFYFFELVAVYGKILQFLQENVTIFNRKIVSFPIKIVKFIGDMPIF